MIVPKKSAPGEPPRRRMCVDYRKINKLQPEVTNADGGKGCISLIPLPKIDELYTKLKGYKVFSSLDLRSGYYHIGLTETGETQISVRTIIIREISVQQSTFWTGASTSLFPETNQRRVARMQLCNGLSRRYNHLQSIRTRTP